MVLVGDSSIEALAGASPKPWSIVTLVAPFTFHFKVDEPPLSISAGVALKRRIDGGSGRQEMPDQADNTARLRNKKMLKICLYFIPATSEF